VAATDVGLRPAGTPCRWCVGGQVLTNGLGEATCLQCGRAVEVPVQMLRLVRRVGRCGVVEGRVS
jgi:hypothetical protein